MALALTTGVAGLIDAFTLLHYGVFTANQSGNIVHVGMGLSGAFPNWPIALASIVGFGVGGVVASRLRRAHPGSPPIRELLGVFVAVALWATADLRWEPGSRDLIHRGLLAALAAVGLGILAMLFLRTAGIRTSTTYQTSTVLNAAQGLSDWIGHTGRPGSAARRWMLGLLGIACYGAGGGIGTLAQRSPAWVFALVITVLATLMATARRDTSTPRSRAGHRPR